MGKVVRLLCILLLVVIIFLIGWWRHTHPHSDDDDNNGPEPVCPTGPVPCLPNPFGIAGNFSLFALGNIVACSTGAEGGVAAKGTVNLRSYSVGVRSTAGAIQSFNLVTPEALTWNGGNLWHSGVISKKAAEIDGVNLIINSRINSLDDCCADPNCGYCTEGADIAYPIDFLGAEHQLNALHAFFLKLNTTEGATSVLNNGTLELSCPENHKYSVFSGVDLANVTNLSLVCPNQTVLINYNQSVETIAHTSVLSTLTSQSEIIHHFSGSSLTVSKPIVGAIFAPKTRLSSTVLITGNVIVGSYHHNEIGSCNTGRIANNIFGGCIQQTLGKTCCSYTKDGVTQSECAEGCCDHREGWTVVANLVANCESCL